MRHGVRRRPWRPTPTPGTKQPSARQKRYALQPQMLHCCVCAHHDCAVCLQVKRSLREKLHSAEEALQTQRAKCSDLQGQLADAAKKHDALAQRSEQQLRDAQAQAEADVARAEGKLGAALEEHAAETKE